MNRVEATTRAMFSSSVGLYRGTQDFFSFLRAFFASACGDLQHDVSQLATYGDDSHLALLSRPAEVADLGPD